MEPETKVVHVAKDGQPALAAPNFVIEDGERLYVAIAVLEYDPGAQDLTDEQKRGIEELRADAYRPEARNLIRTPP